MNSGWARGVAVLAMVAALAACNRAPDTGGADAEDPARVEALLSFR